MQVALAAAAGGGRGDAVSDCGEVSTGSGRRGHHVWLCTSRFSVPGLGRPAQRLTVPSVSSGRWDVKARTAPLARVTSLYRLFDMTRGEARRDMTFSLA